jgi:hypothetical protein
MFFRVLGLGLSQARSLDNAGLTTVKLPPHSPQAIRAPTAFRGPGFAVFLVVTGVLAAGVSSRSSESTEILRLPRLRPDSASLVVSVPRFLRDEPVASSSSEGVPSPTLLGPASTVRAVTAPAGSSSSPAGSTGPSCARDG